MTTVEIHPEVAARLWLIDRMRSRNHDIIVITKEIMLQQQEAIFPISKVGWEKKAVPYYCDSINRAAREA